MCIFFIPWLYNPNTSLLWPICTKYLFLNSFIFLFLFTATKITTCTNKKSKNIFVLLLCIFINDSYFYGEEIMSLNCRKHSCDSFISRQETWSAPKSRKLVKLDESYKCTGSTSIFACIWNLSAFKINVHVYKHVPACY